MNVPNILTLIRIATITPFLYFYLFFPIHGESIALIIFILHYVLYFISAVTNRDGWGGADVMILASLTCGFGIYTLFIILISSFTAYIYTIIKSIYKKEKITKTTTKFIPFIFISTIIIILFCFLKK